MPPVTLIIVVLTCLVSIAAFSNRDLYGKLLFDPYLIKEKKQWYRFFSHSLVHADWMHLGFNMYALYIFGQFVEELAYPAWFGNKAPVLYALLYVLSLPLSSLRGYERYKNDPYYRAVGASGAVSAVIFASILLNPDMKLALLFLPIPIPGYIFGGLYLLYSWYMSRKNIDNVDHEAHFWGAAFGIVFTIVLKPQVAQVFIEQVTN